MQWHCGLKASSSVDEKTRLGTLLTIGWIGGPSASLTLELPHATQRSPFLR